MLSTVTGKQLKAPTITEIQEILVRIGDKNESFLNSRDWIGSAETCYVIDELFQVPCYLHHISSNEGLSSRRTEIVNYFKTQGGLIAMGGDQDASSKLIAGVNTDGDNFSLLIVVSDSLQRPAHCITFFLLLRILILSEFQRMHQSS